MSLLGIMTYITVFAVCALFAWKGVLYLLIWNKPNDYIRLTYKDAEGKTHVKDIKIGKDVDSLELARTLNSINSNDNKTHLGGSK
ncbi:hypothetical protein FBY13_112190 [Pantoea sp. SJZ147]|nr:hypothetical protein FBY13_112190 [Pantoea sp. SJZ147]